MPKAKPKKDPSEKNATLVLGAGAPNAPLMSGAIASIYEAGKTFNNFFTSGGGGLIGMSLVAPLQENRFENVKSILNTAVADPIYDLFPIDYKVFRKDSPFQAPVQAFFDLFKIPGKSYEPRQGFKRLYNDGIDFWAAALAPGGIPNYWSKSVCAPFALLQEYVDFDKLKDFTGNFYLNAYNITEAKMRIFDQKNLTPEHFILALSFPFIYPPGKHHGDFYYEGADLDPMNLLPLMEQIQKGKIHTDTIVLIDVLGSLQRAIVRPPRNLWDAFGIMMLTSITSVARWSKAYFLQRFIVPGADDNDHNLPEDHYAQGQNPTDIREYTITSRPEKPTNESYQLKFIEINFDVPPSQWPILIQWNYRNLSQCWDLGRATGRKFIQKYRDLLPDREGDSVNVKPPA
jgi:NTE family protein